MNVIPAQGFVVERAEADGSRTVLPLQAWEVSDHGELLVLPRSCRNWLVRPQMEGDARFITTTSARMRREAESVGGPFGPVKSPGYVEGA